MFKRGSQKKIKNSFGFGINEYFIEIYGFSAKKEARYKSGLFDLKKLFLFVFAAVFGLLFKLVVSPHRPQGTGQEEGGIETGTNTDTHREGKADYRVEVLYLGNNADCNDRDEG